MCGFILVITGCSGFGSTEKESLPVEDEIHIEVEKVEEVGEREELDNAIDKGVSSTEEAIEEVEETLQPKYKLNPANFLIQPLQEAVEKKVVLFTIDDAPDQYGAEMAQILYDLDVNAIFFVNGIFINKGSGKEQLKKIHELGFEIGNHTISHKNLSKLSAEEQKREIVELNDQIEEIIGERPRFFRAPFGVNTDVSKQVVKEEGMQWMNWTYGYDYFKEYTNREALVDIMVNAPELIDGANLLMHDRKWTLEALEDIVTGLRDKGFKIVDPKEIK